MSFSPLKPDLPAPPYAASPLYAVLVPHSNACGVDYEMAEPYLRVPAFPKDWTPNGKPFAHPVVTRILQWVIDLIQLAHTCRHAFRHMNAARLVLCLRNTTSCAVHNDILNPMADALGKGGVAWAWYCAMGGSMRSSIPYPAYIPWNRLERVLAAALLDRLAVAAWWKPVDVEMNLKAMRDWSPLVGRDLRRYDWQRHPLIRPSLPLLTNPVVRDKLHGRAVHQMMWIMVALQMEAPCVPSHLVSWAGLYDKVWAWVKLRCDMEYRGLPSGWERPLRHCIQEYDRARTRVERHRLTHEATKRWMVIVSHSGDEWGLV